MGLLKHAVLPLFALLHASVSLVLWTQGPEGVIPMFDWPAKAGDDQAVTVWEAHALGILGGCEIALSFLCVVGIFESSRFRSIIIVAEAMVWGVGAFDAFKNGVPYEFAATMFVIATVSGVIHSQEPGLFAKDKTAVKSD
eukprot:CAMPEP_0172467020 /NCGR_PEP_ID=MMETSP1065-20121228/57732_1 /TAXON_ID=265537 /ORGANISM="Amphiprora paludosa, Strain CCMP125" /LENGTH=139 /DNA_ID=CAMNT_0013224037 /DNA_START=76 /DNA_END=495 /DNA_ORIENTATION=-